MHGPLAALRVAAAVALALLYVEARATHRLTMERAGRQVTYVFDEDRARIDEAGSPCVLIFDGKAMLYFEVDTKRKTFAVATLKDVQAEGRALESELSPSSSTPGSRASRRPPGSTSATDRSSASPAHPGSRPCATISRPTASPASSSGWSSS